MLASGAVDQGCRIILGHVESRPSWKSRESSKQHGRGRAGEGGEEERKMRNRSCALVLLETVDCFGDTCLLLIGNITAEMHSMHCFQEVFVIENTLLPQIFHTTSFFWISFWKDK